MQEILANIQLGANIVGLILFTGVLPRSVLNVFEEKDRKPLFVCWLILVGIVLIILQNLLPVLSFMLRGQPEVKPILDAIIYMTGSVVAIGLGVCARLLYWYDDRPITQVIKEIFFR